MAPEETKTIEGSEEGATTEKSAIEKWQEQNEAKKELVGGKPLSINPEADQFVMVHMTKYFPDGGIIKTTGQAREEYFPRESIHFSLNGMVAGGFEGAGDWDNNPYAIIVPMEKAKDRVVDLYSVDTWVVGEFGIPEGSEIIILEGTLSEEEIAKLNAGNVRVRIEKNAKNIKEAVTRRIEEKNYTPAQSGSWAWDSLEVLDDQGKPKTIHGERGEGGTTEYVRRLQKKINIPLCKPHSESSFAILENKHELLTNYLKDPLFDPKTGFNNLENIYLEMDAAAGYLSKSRLELTQKKLANEEARAFSRIEQNFSKLTKQALDKISAEFGRELKNKDLSWTRVTIEDKSTRVTLEDPSSTGTSLELPDKSHSVLERAQLLGVMAESAKNNDVSLPKNFISLEKISFNLATTREGLTLYLTQALYGKNFTDPSYRAKLIEGLYKNFAEIKKTIDQRIRAESKPGIELAVNQELWGLEKIEGELTKIYFADLKGGNNEKN